MNTCQTCQHWGNGFPVNDKESNECGAISLDYPDSKDPAFLDVQIADDSNLNAALKTRYFFGCSLYMMK